MAFRYCDCGLVRDVFTGMGALGQERRRADHCDNVLFDHTELHLFCAVSSCIYLQFADGHSADSPLPQTAGWRHGSMVFTLLNMLIAIEFVPNEWMLWLIVLATGGAALIGFRLNYRLLKLCFGTLFGISAFFLLLFQLVEPMPLLTVLAFSIITVILISMYRLKPARQT